MRVTDNWLGNHNETESLPDLPKLRAINRFSVEVIKDWKNDLKLAGGDESKKGSRNRLITPAKNNNN